MVLAYTTAGVRIAVSEPIRIVPPTADPVDLDDVKEHLRVTSDVELKSIQMLLRAATNYVEEYTGLALITQTWEQRYSAFPAVLTLAKRPVQAILSIEDRSGGGSPSTIIAPSGYLVAGLGATTLEATIRADTTGWPSLAATNAEAISVVYEVGFGDTPDAVPEMLRFAVMLLVGIWFDDRMAPDLAPVHALLADWRPLGFA